ncbi:MAG: glutamate-1-semialdehyde 2,1-aminomutase [Lachnospiraceae bacterium]|nr:glutamate-1-semialdehyde 2,1-aminomutase [Lachnospiraceae bacterium]
MKTERSKAAFEEAQKYIPGGVNSPVRAYRSVGQTPRFIHHAKGSHIWDIDGNEYVDYIGSWGPNILGAAYPPVVRAVQEKAESGLTFGAPTEQESRLAELIIDAVPAISCVRLVNSGTEAVMSAIRVARGYTGRDKIVKFRGNYHGHSDGLLVQAGSGLLTGATPDSAGVPADYTKCTLLADYNDTSSVQKLFDANPDEIAAVIVEPVAANMGVVPPKEGFLADLRRITEENNAVLIFDEVITGFRLSYGGAGAYYGIRPDMVTLGKIVGGGMPLAAYGGKKEIMECVAPSGPVYQAGTLSGNPIAVAAGIATLEALRADLSVYEKMDAYATRIEQAFLDKGMNVNRAGSLISVFMTKEKVVDERSARTSDTKKFAEYFAQMMEQGIYIAPSQFEAMFISAAHAKEDLEQTLHAINSLRA